MKVLILLLISVALSHVTNRYMNSSMLKMLHRFVNESTSSSALFSTNTAELGVMLIFKILDFPR